MGMTVGRVLRSGDHPVSHQRLKTTTTAVNAKMKAHTFMALSPKNLTALSSNIKRGGAFASDTAFGADKGLGVDEALTPQSCKVVFKKTIGEF